MDQQTRLEGRKLLIRAKTYRLVAIVFALVGIGLLAYVYNTYTGENFLAAIIDPFFVGLILVPFIPVFILSLLAKRCENKLVKIIEKEKAKGITLDPAQSFSSGSRNDKK